jgi:ribosomal protein S18 acetylase RimI-like enzyme
MEYELRPAAETDKEAARTMNDRCYRDVVERQFGVWDTDVQRHFFEKKWDPNHYQMILHQGKMVGVLASETREDHVYLSEIQIDPEFQGRGLGTAVVSDVVREARDAGLPVRLQVLLENRARTLYERLGFAVTGETETHFLMERAV